MSIFKGLFKSRDKPQNRMVGSGYPVYMSMSSAGKTVTERSAMQMTESAYDSMGILFI